MDYILTSGFDSVRPVIIHVDVKRKPRLFKFIFFTTNVLNLIVFFCTLIVKVLVLKLVAKMCMLQSRHREVCLRDVRMALKSVTTMTFDASSG